MNEIEKIIISALVSAIVTASLASILTLFRRTKAIAKGVQDLLRGEIIHHYNKAIDRGYCPIHTKQLVEEQYKSYHALGGNGVITEIYKELLELPTEPKEL